MSRQSPAARRRDHIEGIAYELETTKAKKERLARKEAEMKPKKGYHVLSLAELKDRLILDGLMTP